MWIVNSSPLILLGKINHLPLLPNLAPQLGLPGEVAEEITAGPADDPARRWLAAEGRHHIMEVVPHDPRIVAWDLGAGETAVISWALRLQTSVCVMDDRAARDCALVFGVAVIGSVGILVRAKRAGLIPVVRPQIEALLRAGALLHERVISEALDLAEEI